MYNGNSTIFQWKAESTTNIEYGDTAGAMAEQIKISSESIKPVYNKIDEGLATGGRGAGLKATMGIGVEGNFSTLVRPDMLKMFYGVLGQVDGGTERYAPYNYTFTCRDSNYSRQPFFSVGIKRGAFGFLYTGMKINSLTLSASAGDYLKADVSLVGREEKENWNPNPDLTPSPYKAYKFAQGKVYEVKTTTDSEGTETTENVEIYDITSMSLEINNNMDYQTQTTSTGDYYAEPDVGTREISLSLEAIYSENSENLRKNYYKTDNTLAVQLKFVSDEAGNNGSKYSLSIDLPCCQMSDADANVGGLETLKQNMTLNVVDNVKDELITITAGTPVERTATTFN